MNALIRFSLALNLLAAAAPLTQAAASTAPHAAHGKRHHAVAATHARHGKHLKVAGVHHPKHTASATRAKVEPFG